MVCVLQLLQCVTYASADLLQLRDRRVGHFCGVCRARKQCGELCDQLSPAADCTQLLASGL